MYSEEQRWLMQQQKAYEKQQMMAMREHQRQQQQMQREYEREMQRQAKEMQRLDMQYSKYPNLNDKLIRECITEELYKQLSLSGMKVPEPAVLITKLKFRRIRAEGPMPYKYKGNKIMAIKHACKFSGVTYNKLRALRVVYHSPHGERYNHDYNYVLPYFYCYKCKAVIYFFNG